MSSNMVNFAELTDNGKVRNLSGKERGIAARRQLHIDDLDNTDGVVEVVVPDYVDTISPSYFQGLFSESIARLNGRDGFLRKYQFQSSNQVRQWIDVGIRNATASRRPLI